MPCMRRGTRRGEKAVSITALNLVGVPVVYLTGEKE